MVNTAVILTIDIGMPVSFDQRVTCCDINWSTEGKGMHLYRMESAPQTVYRFLSHNLVFGLSDF